MCFKITKSLLNCLTWLRHIRRVVQASYNAKVHVVLLICCFCGLVASSIFSFSKADRSLHSVHKPEKVENVLEYFSADATHQFILPNMYIHGTFRADRVEQFNESEVVKDLLHVLNLPISTNHAAGRDILSMDHDETIEFFSYREPMDDMTWWLDYYYWYWQDYEYVWTLDDDSSYVDVINTIGYIPHGFYPRYSDNNGKLYFVKEIRAKAWLAPSERSWHFLLKMSWENPPLVMDNLIMDITYTITDGLCDKLWQSASMIWCTNSWLALHFSDVDFFDMYTGDVVGAMYDSEGWCTVPQITKDIYHDRQTVVNMKKDSHNGVSFYSAQSNLDFTEIDEQNTGGRFKIAIYVNSMVDQWVEYPVYEYTSAFAFVTSVYTIMWSVLIFAGGFLVWWGGYKDQGLLPIFDTSKRNRENIKWLESVTVRLLHIVAGDACESGFADESDLERQLSRVVDPTEVVTRRKVEDIIQKLVGEMRLRRSSDKQNFADYEGVFASSSESMRGTTLELERVSK